MSYQKYTAEEIADKFIETGLLPTRWKFYDWYSDSFSAPTHACALGVINAADRGRSEWNPGYCTMRFFGDHKADSSARHYHNGIADGFNGSGQLRPSPVYLEGYTVGKKAWELATAAAPQETVPTTKELVSV